MSTVPIHREPVRAPQGLVDVVKGQMKVTTPVDARSAAAGDGQLLDSLVDDTFAVVISQIGMRRGYDVGGAGFPSHLEHGNGLFQGSSAIVDAPEDVTVDVDHVAISRRRGLVEPR